jgi:hypothetical protein
MIINTGKDNYKKFINISLPKDKMKVGVMLSGGADSAILLYLLCLEKIKTRSQHSIIPFTVPRTDGAWNYVNGIVGYVRKELGCELPDPVKCGDPDLHHSEQVTSGREFAFANGIEVVYYGSQKTPPAEFPMPGIYPERPDRINYARTICPFAEVDKRNTIELYSIYKQWPLLALTHSCTEQTQGRCGVCFNCTERKWALDAYGFTDSGAM